MAYNEKDDSYTCDRCGLTLAWDGADDQKGVIWECETCGEHFCTACFIKEKGQEAYNKMMEADVTACPKCYSAAMLEAARQQAEYDEGVEEAEAEEPLTEYAVDVTVATRVSIKAHTVDEAIKLAREFVVERISINASVTGKVVSSNRA